MYFSLKGGGDDRKGTTRDIKQENREQSQRKNNKQPENIEVG
jgi:hypothetical protein